MRCESTFSRPFSSQRTPRRTKMSGARVTAQAVGDDSGCIFSNRMRCHFIGQYLGGITGLGARVRSEGLSWSTARSWLDRAAELFQIPAERLDKRFIKPRTKRGLFPQLDMYLHEDICARMARWQRITHCLMLKRARHWAIVLHLHWRQRDLGGTPQVVPYRAGLNFVRGFCARVGFVWSARARATVTIDACTVHTRFLGWQGMMRQEPFASIAPEDLFTVDELSFRSSSTRPGTFGRRGAEIRLPHSNNHTGHSTVACIGRTGVIVPQLVVLKGLFGENGRPPGRMPCARCADAGTCPHVAWPQVPLPAAIRNKRGWCTQVVFLYWCASLLHLCLFLFLGAV